MSTPDPLSAISKKTPNDPSAAASEFAHGLPAPVRQELAAEILTAAQSGRPVIQDFCPLAESLEWELGQQYWRERGSQAFISDPVPFVINNDGNLSRQAADLLYTSLAAAEKEGPLEQDIHVLELGIGVGLFARYFLDSFRDLCRKNDKDYYDRLTYVAADRSEQMLLDVGRRGVLAAHPGRYQLLTMDALRPAEYLARDAGLSKQSGRPFRAVFLNYILDCLPVAVLQLGDQDVRQLHVRTCLARGVALQKYTDLSVRALAKQAVSMTADGRRDLLGVFGLFASEYDYRPVDLATLPYGDFAADFARGRARRIVHNFGAIRALEGLLPLVHEQGFLLINDYGQTEVTAGDDFEHQRFSQATAVGLNFPLLKAYFGEAQRCQWFEPGEGSGHIHSRLLGHGVDAEVVSRFRLWFDKSAYDWLHEPANRARHCVRSGRLELALSQYRDALDRQPLSWVLMNEVARFLTVNMRNPPAGADMARMALALNPTCSSDLWNTLGDALADNGQLAEARHAFCRALEINPRDARARYNLAWTHLREGNVHAALSMTADGLALDQTGEYRERLLRLQQDALEQIAQRMRQQDLLQRNLVSDVSKLEAAKIAADSPNA